MRACTLTSGKILVATVGLPARGKTHLSHAIQRYLRWLGVRCRVFSLGDMRREIIGPTSELPGDYFGHGPKEPRTEQLRRDVKEHMEQSLLSYFDDGGQVAIYDASNSSHTQRQAIRDLIESRRIQIIFIGAQRWLTRKRLRRQAHGGGPCAQHLAEQPRLCLLYTSPSPRDS